ncbi:MAG: sporulation initiation factor Spo0A C-terminal domain-containing protein [Huintestinicola sp.]
MNQSIKVVVAEENHSMDREASLANTICEMGVTAISAQQEHILSSVLTENPDAVVIDGDIWETERTLKFMAACRIVAEKPFVVVSRTRKNESVYKACAATSFVLRSFLKSELSVILPRICYRELTANPDRTNQINEREKAVTEVIRKMGIPANIKGYVYLRSAVMLAMSDTSILESVTKELYPAVAKYNHTTSSRVERAIRHAITTAWERRSGDVDYIESRLGYKIDYSGKDCKPTNSELIALISDSLRLSCG